MNRSRVILLVEDNEHDVELALRAFNKSKVANEIVVVRDGQEALDFLFGAGAHAGRDTSNPPEVVLLDLKLPKVDGLEVLRRLRADPRTRRMSVVVLTSSNEERDIVTSYDLGANSFVRKPVDFTRFTDAAHQLGPYWLVLNEMPPAQGSRPREHRSRMDSGGIPMRFTIGLALALFLPATFNARAQDAWPARTIKFVVPSSPSGGTDLYARLLAQALTEPLRQQVVIENRPGGAGNIGAVAVAKALPDGYTFLVSGNPSLVINPALYKDLPYSAERDFAPVARGVVNPLVLSVLPEVPARSVAELVALAKRDPGTIAFASAGSTTATYFGVRLLEEVSGARFLHVPYKGAGQAYQGLFSGQIKFMLADMGTAIPHIRSGKLVALAATYSTRMLPGVPTMAELGYPDSDVSAVFSVVAPAAVPRGIVEHMNAAINQAMKTPWLASKLEQAVFIPVFETPEQFAATLKRDREKWAAIVKRLGIRVE